MSLPSSNPESVPDFSSKHSTPPSAAPAIDLATGASTFANALESVVKNAVDVSDLRASIVDTLLQYRSLVGVAWFATTENQTTILESKLDHPALKEQRIQAWIAENNHRVIETGRDVLVQSSEIRNLSLVSVPLRLPEQRIEALTLLVSRMNSEELEQDVLAARVAQRTIAQWYIQSELRDVQQQLRIIAAQLELSGLVEAAQDTAHASRVLADQVRNFLEADLVAVGICGRNRVTTRLMALSGLSEFDPQSTRVIRIKAALDEAVTRNMPALWPPADPTTNHQLLAHQKMGAAYHHSAIISTPLHAPNGKPWGAITVAGNGSLHRNEKQRFLNTLDLPIGSALHVVSRSRRPLVHRLCHWLFGKSRRRRVITSAAIMVALLLILLIPTTYRIPCGFRCEPMERRFSVAPYDGLLEKTYVKTGDLVEAGQLLARMDRREIRMEMSGLIAEQKQAQKKKDVTRFQGKIAESAMAALESDRIGSRFNVLQYRLDNLDIRSPIDGVILSGMKDRRENVPVTIGQTLYEIAPLSPIRLEIAVPAEEIAYVKSDMHIQFRPDSNVGSVGFGTIQRIRPRSEIVNQRNVFVAEVEFANLTGELRPGMEGSARISSGTYRLGWNLFHRAIDYTRSALWW